MTTQEELKSCEGCGATVYPEHIEAGRAAYWAGQLLCPVCLNEKKSETASGSAPPEAEEPLSLVDEEEVEKAGRKITALGAAGLAAQKLTDDSKLTRPLNKTGTGATRMKIFHTKMNDGASQFLSQTINEWLDGNPDIEVKFVDSTVGVWEGKHPEPHLILSVWY